MRGPVSRCVQGDPDYADGTCGSNLIRDEGV